MAGEVCHEAGHSVSYVCVSLALYKTFNTLWLYLSQPHAGVAIEVGHEAGDSVSYVCVSLALYKSFNTLWLYLSRPQVWLVRFATRLATVSAMSV